MQESPAGVLVAAQQSNESAQHDFERLLSLVASGEVKGVVFDNTAEDGGASPTTPSKRVRRGAVWGASIGFLLGLVPLLASTLMAAGIGALLARASEVRIEGGTAPRIRFPKNRNSMQSTRP
jgi:hypothetical protein